MTGLPNTKKSEAGKGIIPMRRDPRKDLANVLNCSGANTCLTERPYENLVEFFLRHRKLKK